MWNKSLKFASVVCLLKRRLIISDHFQQWMNWITFLRLWHLRCWGKKKRRSKVWVSSKKSFDGSAFSSRAPALRGRNVKILIFPQQEDCCWCCCLRANNNSCVENMIKVGRSGFLILRSSKRFTWELIRLKMTEYNLSYRLLFREDENIRKNNRITNSID